MLALAALASACSEPARSPGATAQPTEVTAAPAAVPSALAVMLPGLVDETGRLRSTFGDGFAEVPLRLALTVLEDHVVADQTADISGAVAEARGLLEGYRQGSDEAIDPSELDALDLLLMSVDEAVAADRKPASLKKPVVLKKNGGAS